MLSVNDLQFDNVETFRQVYHSFHGKLYAFVYKRTLSHYLAEEVVQQAFIRLWERRASLSAEVSLSTQLFQITKTIMIDELRKEATKRTHYDTIIAEMPVSTEDVLSTEDDRLLHKDQLEEVQRIVDSMPPVRKHIFRMSRIEHLSYKEIAAQLSISPKTVENHIARALRQLREAIYFLFL
jgi:RNA polymerase sigma-70 factor (family 1)